VSVIEIHDLRRVFGTTTGVIRRKSKEIVAVNGVSFDVQEGELFGLLGPNGAGKTTMVKMLTTLLIPTDGSARILGHDVVKEAGQIRSRIGFIFGASVACIGDCPPRTICATSPICTWWSPRWPASAFLICWSWWG